MARGGVFESLVLDQPALQQPINLGALHDEFRESANARYLPQIRMTEQPDVGIEQRVRFGQAHQFGFPLRQKTEQRRNPVAGFHSGDFMQQVVESQCHPFGGRAPFEPRVFGQMRQRFVQADPVVLIEWQITALSFQIRPCAINRRAGDANLATQHIIRRLVGGADRDIHFAPGQVGDLMADDYTLRRDKL